LNKLIRRLHKKPLRPGLPNILMQNPWKLLSKWECQKA
jgi:hypothetical protein